MILDKGMQHQSNEFILRNVKWINLTKIIHNSKVLATKKQHKNNLTNTQECAPNRHNGQPQTIKITKILNQIFNNNSNAFLQIKRTAAAAWNTDFIQTCKISLQIKKLQKFYFFDKA